MGGRKPALVFVASALLGLLSANATGATITGPTSSTTGTFTLSWPAGYTLRSVNGTWQYATPPTTSYAFSNLPSGAYRFALWTCWQSYDPPKWITECAQDTASLLTVNVTLLLYQDERFSRGYTDHEMLNRTGFIHMNGRVYDPRIGRFVSPDPIVQFPVFSHSYNRYAYVLNSPLSYTDPSGYAALVSVTTDGKGRISVSGPASAIRSMANAIRSSFEKIKTSLSNGYEILRSEEDLGGAVPERHLELYRRLIAEQSAAVQGEAVLIDRERFGCRGHAEHLAVVEEREIREGAVLEPFGYLTDAV